jgi:hypothetical protein
MGAIGVELLRAVINDDPIVSQLIWVQQGVLERVPAIDSLIDDEEEAFPVFGVLPYGGHGGYWIRMYTVVFGESIHVYGALWVSNR